jgi:ABC-type amino acid transport substrate-binding protein
MNMIGLKPDEDYKYVCIGEGEVAFNRLLDELSHHPIDNASIPTTCDMAVSSITVTESRVDMGIIFSAPILNSKLGILVNAPVTRPDLWVFLVPLDLTVWLVIAVTTIMTPIFVFFFESLLSGHSAYALIIGSKAGLVGGLREAFWHGLSHTLSIDVFRVNTLPARLVTAAYAFIVLITSSTYTANLALFLTTRQESGITEIDQLWGTRVSTVSTYLERLNSPKYNFMATATENRDYAAMVRKLKDGVYSAIIVDNTELAVLLADDVSCSLRQLDETIEPFETAIAWRNGFPTTKMIDDVNIAITTLRTQGDILRMQRDNIPEDVGRCEISPDDTATVGVRALRGLWVIILVCGGGSLLIVMFTLVNTMVYRGANARVYQRMTFLMRAAFLPAEQAPAARRFADSIAAPSTPPKSTSANVETMVAPGTASKWRRGKQLALAQRDTVQQRTQPLDRVQSMSDSVHPPNFDDIQGLISELEGLQGRVSQMMMQVIP